jgi:hypothetical protein
MGASAAVIARSARLRPALRLILCMTDSFHINVTREGYGELG